MEGPPLSPRNKRRQLYEEYQREGKPWVCDYCGVKLLPPSYFDVSTNCHEQYNAMVIDHLIPRSQGGTDHRENLRVSCWYCNAHKGDMSPEEWFQFLDDRRFEQIVLSEAWERIE